MGGVDDDGGKEEEKGLLIERALIAFVARLFGIIDVT